MSTDDRPSVTDDARAEARNVSHIGRSFHGTRLEDDCPCPKGPCGLAIHDGTDHGCDQHDLGAARTIRQMHSAADCPAAGRAETTTATTEDALTVARAYGSDVPAVIIQALAAAGLLACRTPSRDEIANALAVTDVHHPDYCDCTETENCHGLDDQVDAMLALLEGGTDE